MSLNVDSHSSCESWEGCLIFSSSLLPVLFLLFKHQQFTYPLIRSPFKTTSPNWNRAVSWMQLVANKFELPIRLLVCKRLTNSQSVTQHDEDGDSDLNHQLALDNEFELIELDPDLSSGQLEACQDDIDAEINKNNSTNQPPDSTLSIEQVDREATSSPSSSSLTESADMDEFETALTLLKSGPNDVAKLHGEDRLRMAEKLTLKIWSAIGGPKDDVIGLDDDSDAASDSGDDSSLTDGKELIS